jgi:RNA polymerase sigma-70 factor, ECF subfamily
MILRQLEDGSDDATLVGRVQAGDRQAFATLYQRHHLPLYRTALALTHERGAAEELLQEAFLRAYRHLARVELPAGSSLRPWLHRILINLAHDWSTRQRRQPGALESAAERLLAASAPSPERLVEQHELERVVADAVARLPFKQRVVVVLYYLHDMDLTEISTTLGLPPGTVKSRLFYGRARLRTELESDRRVPVPVRPAVDAGVEYASA